jgi:hypothetical protein
MEISKEEAQVLLNLIDRVQLSGKEAGTVAYIQNKLAEGLKDQPQEEKPAKK